ncbi:MAG: HNH endonuclease [Deltaproteobacteria bacterium]|nr:HNH endonuclease [Deltaproteobacteria bacterium]
MGDITYPRVAGVVFVHGAFQRGDAIYLPRKGAKKILRYKGWTFQRIEFKKRPEAERVALRTEFNRSVRTAYLRQLAESRRDELYVHGLAPTEVAAMAKGDLPFGYQVHHIIPLDDGGTNAFENLILLRNNREHSALSAYQNAFTRGLSPGDSVTVDYPVPIRAENFAVYPPASLSEPEELQLWPRRR